MAEEIARLLPWLLTVLILVGPPGLIVLWWVLWRRKARRQEQVVRIWADGQNYSVSDLRCVRMVSGLGHYLPLVSLLRLQMGWRITVYDDQGGQKHGLLVVTPDGGVAETWA